MVRGKIIRMVTKEISKKRESNPASDIEEVGIPFVMCSVCGNPTTTGLHRQRWHLIKKSYIVQTGSGPRIVPPEMRREDVYMCTSCIEKGKKWPGKDPR